ncbi:hypothetical protein KSS87_017680 [Heliosperma pusillum]|nr:hypothetical protein KSS87_017680 [Heliosperma pusillum]
MVDDGMKNRRFLVEYNTANNETKCDCKLFERRGFICRHVIWVWKGRMVYNIPELYILTRWTKKSCRPIGYDENGKVVVDFDEGDRGRSSREKNQKNKEIKDLLGCKAPREIDTLPPHKANNKGSGKRQISSKEKAVRKRKKRKRRCGNCKRWVNQNIRTCNLPFVEDLPFDDDERETDDEEPVCPIIDVRTLLVGFIPVSLLESIKPRYEDKITAQSSTSHLFFLDLLFRMLGQGKQRAA